MRQESLEKALSSPATAFPAVLEGKWLGQGADLLWTAVRPASVLEGGAEAFEEFPAWFTRHTEQFPFGAAVGFASYELSRYFERLPLRPDPGIPDFSFAYYPFIQTAPSTEFGSPPAHDRGMDHIETYFDRPAFCQKVEKIRQYIAAGDIYQANLTEQVSVPLGGQSTEQIYKSLAPHGASFRAFLKGPQRTIVSNSPERFFRVSRGRILASPIKGTIKRGADRADDAKLASRLKASAKDRAENVMIVDLLRNDLGRICRYETIVTRLWKIDAMPHLFHLVSHVEGALSPGVGPLEILRALFPCGSITGAPKLRAMEVLAEIEGCPRGISMGAIGIVRGKPGTETFEMDFNVAIRTLTIQKDVARFNVGCGIVYDSQPQAEFEEMLLKARPLLEAVGSTTLRHRAEPEAVAAKF